MLLRPATLTLTLLAGGVLLAGEIRADDAGIEFFEKQVRPILVARCYDCHSGKLADGETEPKANLRLDSRAAALKGGDTGPALVPGKPKESLLVDAINYGELYQMPPKSKLPAEEIAALTKWVEMGAPWPAEAAAATAAGSGFNLAERKAEHWCWQPLANVAPPAVQSAAWTLQPLDLFILARLEEKGIAPAPPADKRTLIRRAYFDLIGLPPTPEEIDEFLTACSPSPPHPLTPSEQIEGESGREGERERKAFAAVVDKLLASPHFGERWGRHWLDLVRYSETRGHEFDYAIPSAFEYRDYVIRALNADVPYDQFLVEHVAGDLLHEPRVHPTEKWNESILGTGFWFFGEWVHSPVDIRKDETDRVDNMIDVFSKTFLGLTVSCARCHDHKFDAISQRDYYALAGYLQSSSYRLARFETMGEEAQIARELGTLEEKYRPQVAAMVASGLQSKLEELAKALAADADKLRTELQPVVSKPPPEAKVIALDPWYADGPTFGAGPVPVGRPVLSQSAEQPIAEVAPYTAIRREPAFVGLALAEGVENDAGKLATYVRAGRTLKTPTIRLESGKLHYLVAGAGHVYACVDSHAMINGPLHGQLVVETGANGDSPLRWATHDLSAYAGHRVHLEFTPKGDEDFHILQVVEAETKPPEIYEPRNELVAEIAASGGQERFDAARRILARALADLAGGDNKISDRPAANAKLNQWTLAHPLAAEALTAEQKEQLAALMNEYLAERGKIVASIRLASRAAPALWDGTGIDENLLIRGNPKTVGPVVPRRMLEAWQGSGFGVQGSGSGSGRLQLARELVSGRNPIPARVMVNRVWHHLLGRGIVASTDNFGVLGEKPSHPQLLDFLAGQFMQDGWSVKRMIRSIMLSSTYRQAGHESGARSQGPGASEIDPQNLLLHRANVKRLEGEAIRDAILAISGRLDRRQFGPSVPVHLTPFMQGRGRPAASGPVDGDGRRSIYIAVRRNFLPPMMLAFDTPPPLGTVGRRNVSNVPAQALILMNDPFVIEQAQRWAARTLATPRLTAAQRIERMYLEAIARPPSEDESAAALAFLASQGAAYGIDGEKCLADERTWADLAHVLFNVKEFVYLQ